MVLLYAGGKKAKIEEEDLETQGTLPENLEEEEENAEGLTEEEASDDADGPVLPLGLTGEFSPFCFSDFVCWHIHITS